VTELGYFSTVVEGKTRLAVIRRASYIVSGDRLLLALETYEDIEILTARQFLGVLPKVPTE